MARSYDLTNYVVPIFQFFFIDVVEIIKLPKNFVSFQYLIIFRGNVLVERELSFFSSLVSMDFVSLQKRE